MTVLSEEDGDCLVSRPPPRKRLCLSTSRKLVAAETASASSPSSVTYQMATPLDAGVMLNGYELVESHHKNCSPDDSANSDTISPIATLCNLGNTCFLNSVLYTLRFAPSFLHNLHHLAVDLTEFSGRHPQLKGKSSSLGRGIGGGSKSWSSKDLPSLGATGTDAKIALATERLHELYESLHNAELKDHTEPFQPEVFLHALRDVNPIFEGNQQHDAHELLVCLLDNVRETCRQLSQAVSANERQRSVIIAPPPRSTPTKQSWSVHVRKSLKIGRTKSGKINTNFEKKPSVPDAVLIADCPIMNGDTERNGEIPVDETGNTEVVHNFMEDFQGVSILRTTCLECEQITERKESFCDICVPITVPNGNCDDNMSALYRSAIVTEEFLHDTNKYWCEQCLRYNEAKRCVRFETLPRLLILQLKRFSSGFGSVVSKVNEHMPTPLVLSCFCEKCMELEENERPHRYELYGVIMHLGATMASGHYVTYVRGRDTTIDCAHCTRDKRKTASLSGGAGKTVNPVAAEKTSGSGLLRFFKSSKTTNGTGGGVNIGDSRGPYFSPCRSADCCGVKLRGEDSLLTSQCCGTAEPVWLECDDESVRTLTRKQLEELLAPKSAKNSALTPYLLFYARVQP